MYGGVRGRKTRVGEKLHRFPPTRLSPPLHPPLYTLHPPLYTLHPPLYTLHSTPLICHLFSSKNKNLGQKFA